MRISVLCLAAASALAAQQLPLGGDAPFLLENGWTALLSGKDLSGWQGDVSKLPNEWLSCKGVTWDGQADPTHLGCVPGPGGRILNSTKGRCANIFTKKKFGDVELYVEFMLARKSNSGVYLHGLYEVQVFDSYGKPTPPNYSDGGGIYHRWINERGVGGSSPKVNASLPPGQWQSYHIWFRAPRFDAAGKKIAKAHFVKVIYNGMLVQEDVDVDGPTRAAMDIPEAAQGPIMLQGDHGPVAYRNIYIRPLR